MKAWAGLGGIHEIVKHPRAVTVELLLLPSLKG